MATTGELRAIIQELHLIEVGEATSYLGEEAVAIEELSVTSPSALTNETPDLMNYEYCPCQVL